MIKHHFDVVDQALIEKVSLDVSSEDMAQPHWIFFSSRFGVESFFEQTIHLSDVKWAAIGGITAEELSRYISDPIQFIGDSNSTQKIAQSFEQLCVGQTVWFPGSLKSKRIVQKHLDEVCDVVDLPLYDTIKAPAAISEADIYIFTSPLNVESFFESNHLSNDAEIWAIGKTTEAALKEFTELTIRLPRRSSVKEILETIIKERTKA